MRASPCPRARGERRNAGTCRGAKPDAPSPRSNADTSRASLCEEGTAKIVGELEAEGS